MYFIHTLFIMICASIASAQEATQSHHNSIEGEHYIESPLIEIPHTPLTLPFQSDGELEQPMMRGKGNLPEPALYMDTFTRRSQLNDNGHSVKSIYARINWGSLIGSNIDITSIDKDQVFYSSGQFDNRTLGIALGKYQSSSREERIRLDRSYDYDEDDILYEFEFRFTPNSMSSLEIQQSLRDFIQDRHPQQIFHPSNGTWSEMVFGLSLFINTFERQTGSNVDTYIGTGVNAGHIRMNPSPELLELGFQPDTLLRFIPMVGIETDFFHNNPVGLRLGFRLYFPECCADSFEFYKDGHDIFLANSDIAGPPVVSEMKLSAIIKLWGSRKTGNGY